jgi:hypothetical protein
MKRLGAILILAILSVALAAQTESRIALVMGNAAYVDIPALKNSVNDARDMAASLKRVGWRVIEAYDADRRTMLKSVGSFRDALRGTPDSMALFYYAGHGVQLENKNYLLPIGEEFEGPDDVKFSALNLDDVIGAYSDGKALKCVTILDACRENPFDKAKTRNIGSTRGLSVVPAIETQGGSATIFATAAGDVAQDGTGRNGIFTNALLKYVESGKPLGDIFASVAKDVKAATGGKQNPFINSSGLISDIYLSKAKADAAAAPAAASGTPAAAAVQDGGKARFEALVEGSVYLGDELIGDLGPGQPLLADALPVGRQDFRFEPRDGSDPETKPANITVRAATTIVFAKASAPVEKAPTEKAPAVAAGAKAPDKEAAAPAAEKSEVRLLIAEREEYKITVKQKRRKAALPITANIAGWTATGVGAAIALFGGMQLGEKVYQYNTTTDILRIIELRNEIEDLNTLFKIGYLTAAGGLAAGITTTFFLPNTKEEVKAIKVLDLQIRALSM